MAFLVAILTVFDGHLVPPEKHSEDISSERPRVLVVYDTSPHVRPGRLGQGVPIVPFFGRPGLRVGPGGGFRARIWRMFSRFVQRGEQNFCRLSFA